MKIAIQKIDPTAQIPTYAHGTDAGMDLYASTKTVIPANNKGVISTGIAIAIPRLYVGLIWDKSGIAVNQGLKVMGGVIDAGYRGEILVCLLNTTDKDVVIRAHQKIAQMLIQPVVRPVIEVTSELPEAEDERGKGSFGSSGLFNKIRL